MSLTLTARLLVAITAPCGLSVAYSAIPLLDPTGIALALWLLSIGAYASQHT
jgi:hypothetical protein